MLQALSVFFPAYNEEGNIRVSVEKALRALPSIAHDYEVVVVDDGSRDATASIVEAVARSDKRVRFVRHEKNRGYGEALKTGFETARYEYVFFTDSDGQFDIAELASFLPFVPEYDAVIGYRAKRQDPLIRLVNAWLWNVANRLLFGLPVRDIDCAFKLLRRGALSRISFISSGAMTSAELLIKLHDSGARIKELPVTHFRRTSGVATGARLSVILRAVRELWQLYSVEMGEKVQIQFLKFASIGVINTLTTIVVYIVLTRISAFALEHYLLAEGAAYFCGTLVSFTFNRLWTFRQTARVSFFEIARFYLSVLSALVVNLAAMYILVDLVGMFDIVAVIIAAVCTIVWNFTLMKYWVWRKETATR